MKRYVILIIPLTLAFTIGAQTINPSEFRELSREKYIDKCKGAWLGQMIGVTYGDKYEFRSNGIPILEPLDEWTSEALERTFEQDDLYVEMTFLEAIEKYGINISFEQAGKAFAESKYPLWHANRVGRENVRKGIMPPLSGHPRFNYHADDIDFQIESDLFGIITPGLYKEMQLLGEVFGSIMNYGDGLYAGYFIAGMYSSAFFIDDNVEEVIRIGLSCIPPESTYRKCIEDVVTSYHQHPDDWLETWKYIEHKWQDDIDCIPGNLVNIDAKINGAYVAIGLLYGKGDLKKTLEITTRCGQDADCNPSSAAGVLCCMKGFSALEPVWKEYLPKVSDNKFIFTNYSWNTLIDASVRVAEQIIIKAGGSIENNLYKIPIQVPTPPPTLEQWVNKKEIHTPPIPSEEVAKWNSLWKVKSCKKSLEVGVFQNKFNHDNVLIITPPEEGVPALIEYLSEIPTNAKQLSIETCAPQNQPFLLRLRVDYHPVFEQTINDTQWVTLPVNVEKWAGTQHVITIEIFPVEQKSNITACFGNITFQ
ncbi:MAG TPA: ADP-ribosylglycohydrolase family protein [Candidatus Hydrogenedens sp.]|nr:ADP-ribosylglycohydrolase family protein [Candidatus Hydrogenedens sp.]HOL19787.1 ADP-ribosylglycohydrolase family protein [Candidatus Hydrogenedens sp.]HPP59526.1 ADP-ribosylglycohydrolase family protein [Candidatus Hydrogenedens sp.]